MHIDTHLFAAFYYFPRRSDFPSKVHKLWLSDNRINGQRSVIKSTRSSSCLLSQITHSATVPVTLLTSWVALYQPLQLLMVSPWSTRPHKDPSTELWEPQKPSKAKKQLLQHPVLLKHSFESILKSVSNGSTHFTRPVTWPHNTLWQEN